MRVFRKLCLATLIAVYFLILVGGVVRTTGAGMGCPDWPRCFGNWVPPTSASQLPDNYKDIYASFREKKNLKFARYLRAIGLSSVADKIVNDSTVRAETDFSVTKAWIEYGNRLVGVAVGFFIIALFWQSRKFRITHPRIFFFSLATLVAVVFQGWFGSIVVSTNLTTWTVTVHMFLALVIVGFLVYMLSLSEHSATVERKSGNLKWILLACLTVLLIQIFLGTQVRESLDLIAASLSERSEWIAGMGVEFIIHRSFSIVVLLLNAVLVIKLSKTLGPKIFPIGLIILILGSFLSGIGMAYLAVPAVLQPLHLVLATITFGVQLLLLFRMNPRHKAVLTD